MTLGRPSSNTTPRSVVVAGVRVVGSKTAARSAVAGFADRSGCTVASFRYVLTTSSTACDCSGVTVTGGPELAADTSPSGRSTFVPWEIVVVGAADESPPPEQPASPSTATSVTRPAATPIRQRGRGREGRAEGDPGSSIGALG